MAEQEKNKNHYPGGLSDKADEADPKMFLLVKPIALFSILRS